ncbi:hypothetical protein [Caulobacter sp. 3R27C2-B]|uniref:hypothetical protein n=1 Tax=Caulobacter sp. 3R27C2-B TaxID=2502219 RepID=UPI0010F4D64D|nr:hypothetical protein [Caulobacter sp. 3R27C2-B]
MDIYGKLNGPTGVRRHIENIIGHADEDSRVRLRALDEIIDMATAGKALIEAEVAEEVEAAMRPATSQEA